MTTQKLEEKVQQHNKDAEWSKTECRSPSRAHGKAWEQPALICDSYARSTLRTDSILGADFAHQEQNALTKYLGEKSEPTEISSPKKISNHVHNFGLCYRVRKLPLPNPSSPSETKATKPVTLQEVENTYDWPRCAVMGLLLLCPHQFNSSPEPNMYLDYKGNRTGDISPSWDQPNTRVHIRAIEVLHMPRSRGVWTNASFMPPRNMKILGEGKPRGPRRAGIYKSKHIQKKRF